MRGVSALLEKALEDQHLKGDRFSMLAANLPGTGIIILANTLSHIVLSDLYKLPYSTYILK